MYRQKATPSCSCIYAVGSTVLSQCVWPRFGSVRSVTDVVTVGQTVTLSVDQSVRKIDLPLDDRQCPVSWQHRGEDNNQVYHWTGWSTESRRGQEEGGELDSTKKLDASAGPGEIKRREIVLDPQVSQEEIKSREVKLGLRVGFLSLQLFPNGGATDIVTVPHSSWDSNSVVR